MGVITRKPGGVPPAPGPLDPADFPAVNAITEIQPGGAARLKGSSPAKIYVRDSGGNYFQFTGTPFDANPHSEIAFSAISVYGGVYNVQNDPTNRFLELNNASVVQLRANGVVTETLTRDTVSGSSAPYGKWFGGTGSDGKMYFRPNSVGGWDTLVVYVNPVT